MDDPPVSLVSGAFGRLLSTEVGGGGPVSWESTEGAPSREKRLGASPPVGEFDRTRAAASEQLLEILDRKPGVAHDAARGECVDWIWGSSDVALDFADLHTLEKLVNDGEVVGDRILDVLGGLLFGGALRPAAGGPGVQRR